MSFDIERTVIYDVLVPTPEASLMGDSRTVITAGDDGFISICQREEAHGEWPAMQEDVGLTPDMIAAIVKWASSSTKETPDAGHKPSNG